MCQGYFFKRRDLRQDWLEEKLYGILEDRGAAKTAAGQLRDVGVVSEAVFNKLSRGTLEAAGLPRAWIDAIGACTAALVWQSRLERSVIVCTVFSRRRRHPGGGGASGRCVRCVRVVVAALGSQLHGVNGGRGLCSTPATAVAR